MIWNGKYTVCKLDCDVNIGHIPTIKSAKLVYIKGKNMLKTRVHAISYREDYSYCQICLNDTPIIQINSSICPTCSNLLATGYGIETANCKEIKEIRDQINEPFVSLEKTIDNMRPLLALLESGLYIIADAICYPTDGNGNFFWNVPNSMTDNPSTAGVILPDRDYEYVSGHPVYLYPTQNTDCYNEKRVDYYTKIFEREENPPRAIVYNFDEFISFVIDGHHKACAAARLKKPVNCIVIIPCSGIGYEWIEKEQIIQEVCFSEIAVSPKSIPMEYLPKEKYKSPIPALFPKLNGTIIRRKWEEEYLKSVNCYPTLIEYAEMISTARTFEDDISDEIIEKCFDLLNEENQWKIKSILCVMKLKNDPRLKRTAITCVKSNCNPEIIVYAYRILNEIKNDLEIEQLFIDYLGECDDKHDAVRCIVNTYWD